MDTANRVFTPQENARLFAEYLRMRGQHPEQISARKAVIRKKGKAARKARKANRKK